MIGFASRILLLVLAYDSLRGSWEVRFGLFTSSLALVHELDATYALPLRLTSLLSLVRSSSGSVSRLLKQSDSRKHPVSNEKDSEIQGLQPKSSKKRVLL